jgi:hypothetical protein
MDEKRAGCQPVFTVAAAAPKAGFFSCIIRHAGLLMAR